LGALTAHARGNPRARGVLANLRARQVLESGDWTGAEARALDADVGQPGEDDLEFATFAAGYAAARRGETARANELLARLAARNGNGATTVAPGAASGAAVPVIQELSLRAELLAQRGLRDSALALLRRATALEDNMPPEFGPPVVVTPSHELLGTMLLAARRADDAAAEFTKALEVQPGRSAALLGLARAEAARSHADAARRAWTQLAANWERADASVEGLSEARAGAARR
ncbi:MAG: hypothetical protein HY275_09090, partial [Gemmatimonadetes bacterium]|nr:hypothetical protein [Gemmatimonadota bacterium]